MLFFHGSLLRRHPPAGTRDLGTVEQFADGGEIMRLYESHGRSKGSTGQGFDVPPAGSCSGGHPWNC